MRIVLMIFGGLLGLLIGAVAGFGVALAIAAPRSDGTFAMREMLFCLPIGALLGLAAAIALTAHFAR